MSATLEKPKPGLAAALLIPLVIWVVFSIVAIVFAVLGFTRAEDMADDFARVPAGEATSVELSSAGDYRIWLERPGVTDDFGVSASATITGPDGQDVPTSVYIGTLEYDDLSAVLTFDAPEAGTYTFEVTEDAFSSDTTTSDTQFAIGKGNPFAEVGKGFLLMAVIGGIGFLIALVIMIVMLVKRGRSKRRITQAGIQSGGYGGGYGAPSGGYPPPGGYQQPGSSW